VHRKRQRAKPPAVEPLSGSMRLQKILAAAGHGSRRGAETLIRDGRVSVNGESAGLGDSADPMHDVIRLDGERIAVQRPEYWLLHKPTAVVTTMRDTHGRSTVMDFIPPQLGLLRPVGRLDRDTSGLLLMTNDGAMIQALLHPSHQSEKEYRVLVKGDVPAKKLERLAKGIYLDDGRTAPAVVSGARYEDAKDMTLFHLTLIEGRKRQIRRSMLALGHPVKKLVRVRMGPLKLGRLETGKSRPLRPDEIRALKAHVGSLNS